MRMRHISVLPVLGGMLLLGACGEEEPEVEVAPVPPIEAPAVEVQPNAVAEPEAIAQAPGIPVSQIIESPATYTGQTLGGEVRVTEVPTDRGFWIEDEGQRLFAILADQPQEEPKDINPNQTLRLREAVVRDPAFIANIPGEPLDADTRRILNGLPVFLTVDERNIEILQGAAPGM